MTPEEQELHRQRREILAEWLRSRSNGIVTVADIGAVPNAIIWVPSVKETESPEEHVKFL